MFSLLETESCLLCIAENIWISLECLHLLPHCQINFISESHSMRIERKRKRESRTRACSIFVTYTLVWIWEIMHGEAYGVCPIWYDAIQCIHDVTWCGKRGLRKWRRRKEEPWPCARGERDSNFPSGIFLLRKAAGKEISPCIFLQTGGYLDGCERT